MLTHRCLSPRHWNQHLTRLPRYAGSDPGKGHTRPPPTQPHRRHNEDSKDDTYHTGRDSLPSRPLSSHKPRSKDHRTADGTDMTKGRARIPAKTSKPDIHQFS